MSIGNTGNTTSSSGDVSNLLVQGFKAAKENRREEAYNLFCEVVRRDPNNELGWLYRAATTDDLSEAYVCLQRVLSINPSNEKAQRGIERIQARLNSEEEDTSLPGLSNIPTSGTGPGGGRVGEDSVISGFNPIPPRSAAPPPPNLQPTARYPYEEASPSYNYTQQADNLPDVPPTSVPPPFMGNMEGMGFNQEPDFNQDQNEAPFGSYSPQQPMMFGMDNNNPPPAQSYDQEAGDFPGFMNQRYGDSGPAPMEQDELEAPAPNRPRNRAGARGRSGNGKKATAGAGLAPVFGGMTKLRNRGRAAFGTEKATDLDNVGQDRAKRLLTILMVAGIVLAIILIAIFLLTRPAAPTTDNGGDQAAVTPTLNLTGTNPAGTVTIGAGVTAGPAISVPVVGGTTASGSGSSPAVGTQTTPAQPTVAPPTTAAPAVPPPSGALPRAIVYTIKRGDNVATIARQNNTSVEAIASASGLANPGSIFGGQQIVVPVGRPTFRGKGLILKPGETLAAVAASRGLGLDGLVKLNSLNSADEAKPGDAILLP